MTDQADMEALTRARAIVKQFYPEMPANYSGRRVQIAIAAEAAAYARAAEVARGWKSSLRPGSEDRLKGHNEARRDITRAIEALGEAKG